MCGSPSGFDARNPVMNSRLSPGRKTPISSPDSAKMIAATSYSPPFPMIV